MNENIFGGITSNPYTPSGLLSNFVSANAPWGQENIVQIQNKWDKAIEKMATRVDDDKIKLLRTTNYIYLK